MYDRGSDKDCFERLVWSPDAMKLEWVFEGSKLDATFA